MAGRARGSISSADANQLRESIEHIFNQHCGVVALVLLPPIRKQWMERYEPRLATLKKYVDALSVMIPDPEVRKEFVSDASRRMINRSY